MSIKNYSVLKTAVLEVVGNRVTINFKSFIYKREFRLKMTLNRSISFV